MAAPLFSFGTAGDQNAKASTSSSIFSLGAAGDTTGDRTASAPITSSVFSVDARKDGDATIAKQSSLDSLFLIAGDDKASKPIASHIGTAKDDTGKESLHLGGGILASSSSLEHQRKVVTKSSERTKSAVPQASSKTSCKGDSTKEAKAQSTLLSNAKAGKDLKNKKKRHLHDSLGAAHGNDHLQSEPPAKRHCHSLVRERPSRGAIRRDVFRAYLAPEPCRDVIFASTSSVCIASTGVTQASSASGMFSSSISGSSGGLFSFGGSGGGAASTGAASSATSSSSIFGSSVSSSSGSGLFSFGAASTGASSSGASSGSIFGSISASGASSGSSGSSLFGSSGSIGAASSGGGSIFGALSCSGGGSSGGLFGSSAASTGSTGSTGTGGFQFAAGASIFGGAGNPPASSAFGPGGSAFGFGAPAASSSAGGMFAQAFQQPAGRGRGKRRSR